MDSLMEILELFMLFFCTKEEFAFTIDWLI